MRALSGGYFELTNIDTAVKAQLTKLASVSLCSNTMGQVAVGLMVNPPTSGPELKAYEKEKKEKLASLERRANKVAAALDALEGVSCVRPQGAMYLFPSITLPDAAVKAASRQSMAPDAFYALRLLEGTGLVTVPGSGFGQKNGTWHFRTTFLPAEKQIDNVVPEARGLPRVVPGPVRRRRRALKRGVRLCNAIVPRLAASVVFFTYRRGRVGRLLDGRLVLAHLLLDGRHGRRRRRALEERRVDVHLPDDRGERRRVDRLLDDAADAVVEGVRRVRRPLAADLLHAAEVRQLQARQRPLRVDVVLRLRRGRAQLRRRRALGPAAEQLLVGRLAEELPGLVHNQ